MDRDRSGWSDGRRGFGTVRDAIVDVLSGAPDGMRPCDIHAEIERRCGEPVSRHSVNDMLRVRSQGQRPLFIRLRHGWYSLEASQEPEWNGPGVGLA